MPINHVSTSAALTASSPKGLEATEMFRTAYNNAGLDDESAQVLNKSTGFVAALAAAIRQFSAKDLTFPVYLNIEVGGKSRDKLLAEMKSAGHVVSGWARDIMFKPAWKPGEKEQVKFARTTIRDLGFTKEPTITQLFARIRELGHSLCEPGDVPAIRLALRDQACGDCFWAAMEQISDSNGRSSVFVVRFFENQSWLHTFWVGPVSKLDLNSEVVFRLRK